MAASPPVFFESFTLDWGNGVHSPPSSQTFKIALTNTQPNAATDTEFSDITEIAAGNGYTAGGNTCPFNSWSQTGGVARLFLDDPADFLATGGSIADFRYIVLYNSGASAGTGLIWYADYGATVSLSDGTPFPIQLDQVNGVFSSTAAAA